MLRRSKHLTESWGQGINFPDPCKRYQERNLITEHWQGESQCCGELQKQLYWKQNEALPVAGVKVVQITSQWEEW